MGFSFPQTGGGGGTPAGVAIVRKFPFAFDTPNILTGAALYTPTVGDVLLDAWMEIDTAWNGTTPQGDLSTFDGTAGGLFFNTLPGSSAVDMTLANVHGFGGGLLTGGSVTRLSDAVMLANVVSSLRLAVSPALEFKDANQLNPGNSVLPVKFTNANPVKVVVSQDGTIVGADPGSTHGAAVLYLVTATPA